MSFIFSFEIINVAVREAKAEGRNPDPNIYLWIAAAVADAAVASNDIKTILANGLSKFFVKSKPVFIQLSFW